MSYHRKLASAVAALATVVLATSAHAAIIYTYKGTIESGMDHAGELGGGANQSLAGKAFTLTFTLDPAAPGVDYAPYPGVDQVAMHGGSTAMSGVMSIDGITFDLGTLEDAVVLQSYSSDPFVSEIYHEFFGHESIGDGSGDVFRHWAYIQVFSENGNPIVPLPLSYASPFNYEVQPGDVSQGLFYRSRDNDETGAFDQLISASLSTTSISVFDTSAGAVPEPGAWALMIGGFALAGIILRRRRREAWV